MENKDGKAGKDPLRQVYTITERNGKNYWVRIGAAFVNRDGSETLLLDALPVNGRMQIRTGRASVKNENAVSGNKGT
jgi:hypothetical protein